MALAAWVSSIEASQNSWIAFSLALVWSWLRRWLHSGCAIETVLLLFGPPHHWSLSRYELLSCLNILYAIASTSWLFNAAFTLLCWPLVLATCLVQYAVLSSFTRGRLRSLLKFAHFYQDKVAFFALPSLLLDSGTDGLITIRGITVSFLSLTIELHGIEVGIDLGSGHELSIHSDGITIKLFREIILPEIYGVHWFNRQKKNPQDHGRDSEIDDQSYSHRRSSSLKTKITSEIRSETRRDKIEGETETKTNNTQKDTQNDPRLPPDDKIRRKRVQNVLSRGDVEAEERYDHVLSELHATNQLQKCRAYAVSSRTNEDDRSKIESDHRSVICSNLRESKSSNWSPASQITLSKLTELFLPVSRLLEGAPAFLRLGLWLLSHTHPVTCPAICVSADGRFLGNELLESLVRKHAAKDDRIQELKQDLSSWISSTDIYVDLMDITGHATVPVFTSNPITANVRSTGVAISRIGPNTVHGGRVAQLSGADGNFAIPTCLLPSHAYLAPPPGPEEDDVAPVFMAIRASLPAHFSDSLLNFVATLSKTSQMVDIEEEAGRASSDRPSLYGGDSKDAVNDGDGGDIEDQSRTQRLREKLHHVNLGEAIKHPFSHAKQSLHKEVKKAAVDKVDGAWLAKWTNKFLEQLEWLDGDIGYSFEVPVDITRD